MCKESTAKAFLADISEKQCSRFPLPVFHVISIMQFMPLIFSVPVPLAFSASFPVHTSKDEVAEAGEKTLTLSHDYKRTTLA